MPVQLYIHHHFGNLVKKKMENFQCIWSDRGAIDLAKYYYLTLFMRSCPSFQELMTSTRARIDQGSDTDQSLEINREKYLTEQTTLITPIGNLNLQNVLLLLLLVRQLYDQLYRYSVTL